MISMSNIIIFVSWYSGRKTTTVMNVDYGNDDCNDEDELVDSKAAAGDDHRG